MTVNRVVVFGASGHTGRFVVAELQRRGISTIATGRDESKLRTISNRYSAIEIRVASIVDAVSLDRALAGSSLVVNCAGPFLDTAIPMMNAALRARIHYIDVTAEQAVVRRAFDEFDRPARAAGITILPAMAYYGGLADLLATAAMDDWREADEIRVGVALDSWKPTQGTRLTGERNTARRLVVSHGRLVELSDASENRKWRFPPPFGDQDVAAVPLAEIVLMQRHLRAASMRSYINLAPLAELENPNTPAPLAADGSGRSNQRFVADVIVRRGDDERRAIASGRDIYASTAPLVVEAAARILSPSQIAPGARAPGEIFDPGNFLSAISSEYFNYVRPT